MIQNVRISIEKRWSIMGVDRSRVKISRSSFENHHTGDHEQKGSGSISVSPCLIGNCGCEILERAILKGMNFEKGAPLGLV